MVAAQGGGPNLGGEKVRRASGGQTHRGPSTARLAKSASGFAQDDSTKGTGDADGVARMVCDGALGLAAVGLLGGEGVALVELDLVPVGVGEGDGAGGVELGDLLGGEGPAGGGEVGAGR
jgi:hypothetical protein